MSHLVSKTLQACSSVSHSLSGNFTGHSQDQLLVVKGNVLTLYCLAPLGGEVDNESGNNSNGVKLYQVAEEQLAAPVIAIERIPGGAGGRDLVVLCLSEVHLSVIQYDPTAFKFATKSLHHLGEMAIPVESSPLPPLLRVDPVSGMVAFLMRRRYLFLLPFGTSSPTTTGAAAAGGGTIGPAATAEIKAEESEDDWGDDKEEDAAPTAGGEKKDTAEDVKAISTAANNIEMETARYIDLLEEVAIPLRFIRDMLFVPGSSTYGSGSGSTLMFLREKESVWAGRVKLRDGLTNATVTQTLSCVVNSINFKFKADYQTAGAGGAGASVNSTDSGIEVLPTWKLEGLPFNAQRLIALDQAATGLQGVLCLGANTVVHLTVRGSCTGFYVNKHGEEECRSERSQSIMWKEATWTGTTAQQRFALNFTFDAALCSSAGSQGTKSLFFSHTDSGVICLAQVTSDDKSFHSLELSIKSRTGPSSCMSCLNIPTITEGAAVEEIAKAPTVPGLFVGSLLGDSVLLRLSNNNNNGNEDAAGAKSSPLQLTAVDSLLNVGPIVDAAFVDTQAVDTQFDSASGQQDENGQPTAPFGTGIAATPFIDATDGADQCAASTKANIPLQAQYEGLELLTACGHGSSGKLCIQTRGIRFKSFSAQLLNLLQCFVLQPTATGKRGRDGGVVVGDKDSTASDGKVYVLATEPGKKVTHVLELSPSGGFAVGKNTPLFNKQQRTVHVCRVQKEVTLQVTETTLEVGLVSLKAAQSWELKKMLAFEESTEHTETVLSACYCSKAKSLALLTTRGHLWITSYKNGLFDPKLIKLNAATDSIEGSEQLHGAQAFSWDQHYGHLYAIDTVDGSLHVFSVNTGTPFKLIQHIPLFAVLPELVYNGQAVSLKGPLTAGSVAATAKKPTARGGPAKITEMLVAPVGPVLDHQPTKVVAGHDTRVFLLTSNQELAVYQVRDRVPLSHAPRGLAKESHTVHDAEKKHDRVESVETKLAAQKAKKSGASTTGGAADWKSKVTLLQPFENFGGHRGVYVCGTNPKICLSNRGSVRVLDHTCAHPSKGFAPLTSEIVGGAGAVVCYDMGENTQLELVNLSHPDVQLETEWPTRTLHLAQTPHFVAHSPSSSSCLVAVSQPKAFRPCRAPFDVELDMKDGAGNSVRRTSDLLETVKGEEGIPIPTQERYKLLLYHSNTWQLMDQLPLLENEVILAVKQVDVLSPEAYAMQAGNNGGGGGAMGGGGGGSHAPAWGFAANDMREVFVVGTGFPLGEDVPCRGRVMLLGVKAHHDTKTRSLQVLHASSTKGPVTAVAGGLSGQIVSTVGATVHLSAFNWSEGKLVTKAIYFGSTYITSISTLKNYLLLTDLYNSVCLVRYRADNHTLTTIGKDPQRPVEAHAAEFVYADGELGIVSVDDARNMQLFNYIVKKNSDATTVVESNLSVQGETRLSSRVTRLLRVRLPKDNNKSSEMPSDKSVLFYTTQEGEIGTLQPISERRQRTMGHLITKIAAECPQPAGLHPQFFKTALKSNEAVIYSRSKVIDEDVCQQFVRHSTSDRAAIMGRLGSQPEAILGALASLGDDRKLF